MSIQKNRQLKLKLKILDEFNDANQAKFNKKAVGLGFESRVEVLDRMAFEYAFPHFIKAQIGIITFQYGVYF